MSGSRSMMENTRCVADLPLATSAAGEGSKGEARGEAERQVGEEEERLARGGIWHAVGQRLRAGPAGLLALPNIRSTGRQAPTREEQLGLGGSHGREKD